MVFWLYWYFLFCISDICATHHSYLPLPIHSSKLPLIILFVMVCLHTSFTYLFEFPLYKFHYFFWFTILRCSISEFKILEFNIRNGHVTITTVDNSHFSWGEGIVISQNSQLFYSLFYVISRISIRNTSTWLISYHYQICIPQHFTLMIIY